MRIIEKSVQINVNDWKKETDLCDLGAPVILISIITRKSVE